MSSPLDNNIFYAIPQSESLDKLLDISNDLKFFIDKNKPAGDLWEKIQEKLKIVWTYNSNAIEGSTLTQGETMFFLQHGLTVEGKPFKDFVDAKNHAEAIDFLYEVISGNREITEGLIKEINALLLNSIKTIDAYDSEGRLLKKPASPGTYKANPNHVLQSDGTIHKYVDPLQVQPEMEALCKWIKENIDVLHPVVVSGVAHYNYVRIHPFDDGNGRGSRILMNLILIKKGFPPAVIENTKRREYINSLTDADNGNLLPFILFIAQSCISTMQVIADDLKTNPSDPG